MPAATVRDVPTFVRRTSLGANEYHTNFRKIDCETISLLTSDEAGRVTTQMSKIYLSLLNAPTKCWEREGVLRFTGEECGGQWVTAWEQLVSLVGVASATARKALRWMHEQGVVGYFAGKNGVGIRIFMNRAASSIGRRPREGQKNLRLVHTSTEAPHTSPSDTPFNDSYADLEVLETDLTPCAPKNGADGTGLGQMPHTQPPHLTGFGAADLRTSHGTSGPSAATALTETLLGRLEPAVREAARQAAAREHERTREWLESRGLPKAARVAQREAFNVLRRHGLVDAVAARTHHGVNVGGGEHMPSEARQLSAAEVREFAETCVAMLEVHGKRIDVTLAELSVEAGGCLLPQDVPKVRGLAEALARGGGKDDPLVI